MGCTTVFLLVSLFMGLAAFRCDNYREVCENVTTETSDESKFQGNVISYASNISLLNVESDSSRQEQARVSQQIRERDFRSASRKRSRISSGSTSRKSSQSKPRKTSRRGGRKNSARDSRRDFDIRSESSLATGTGISSVRSWGSGPTTDSAIDTARSWRSDSTTDYGTDTAYAWENGSATYSEIDATKIETFTNDLWKLSANNVNKYITVNLGQGDASVTIAQPLLEVDQIAFEISTIAKVRAMGYSYKLDITKAEDIDTNTREEEDLLIEDLIQQPVIAKMIVFLENEGFIDQGMGRETLKQIWFHLYSRKGSGGINSSSGFQNVFLAEVQRRKPKTISGLHNWIFFHAKEVAGKLDYEGYFKNIPLGSKGSILKFRSTYKRKNGELINIPTGVMFIGTSPEMEMALYTLCFFVRPNGKCPVSLDGTKLNIITSSIIRDGKEMVRTAYPEVL